MGNKLENDLAAIYVRVSTQKDSQRDSPEHQKSICLEKANMEKLKVHPDLIYEDRSTGTSIMSREEIQNLIKDAKKGYFSTIIFASLSRFSRDSHDAITLKRILVNALKIRLISIDDLYDSKVKDDEMIFTIISAVNQKFSEQTSLSSRRGIRESAKSGNFIGSRAPFGYKKVVLNGKKTLQVVEDEADIVKEIYSLYVNNNMGEKQIVKYLNEEKELPSPKGGVWGITSIQGILQNEAYIGRNVFGKHTVIKVYNDLENLQNRKKVLVQKDKREWEKNEGINWEPIIDEDLFQKAQEIRLTRGGGQRGGIRNVSVNPFAGILKCAHCGSNYVSMKSGKVGKAGQVYRYLICSSRRRMGVKGCKNKLWIPLDDFKHELLSELKAYLKEFLNVDEWKSKVKLPEVSHIDSNEKKLKKYQEEINTTRKLLFQLRKEYKIGEIDKEQYEYEKKEYESEISNLQKKINQLENKKTEVINEEIIRENMKEGLAELINLDLKDITETQHVLKKIIYEIKIDVNKNVEIITPIGKYTSEI